LEWKICFLQNAKKSYKFFLNSKTPQISDFFQIFRSPSRRIEILTAVGNLGRFGDLHKCGPFHPNSNLQQLSMAVAMFLPKFNTDFEPCKIGDWSDVCLPVYGTALGYLRGINSEILLEIAGELTCHDYLEVCFWSFLG
jgi:hypothetical protein